MGLKQQGFAMLTGKPEMLEMFSKWNFSKTAVMINGAVTMTAAILILFPKTFVWGNFLMAAGILMITCLHLLDKDLKGATIEIPFLFFDEKNIYGNFHAGQWGTFNACFKSPLMKKGK